MKVNRRCFIYVIGMSLVFSSWAFGNETNSTASCTSYKVKVYSDYYFKSPRHMTADGHGNVWIGNTNDTITKISIDKPDPPIIYDEKSRAPFRFIADKPGNLWIVTVKGKAAPPAETTLTLTKLPVENPEQPEVYSLGSFPVVPHVLMATDPDNNVWLALQSTLIKVPATAPDKFVVYTGKAPAYQEMRPLAITSDTDGNIWIVNINNVTFIPWVQSGQTIAPIVLSVPTGQFLPQEQDIPQIVANKSTSLYIFNPKDSSVLEVAVPNKAGKAVFNKVVQGLQSDTPGDFVGFAATPFSADPPSSLWFANLNTVEKWSANRKVSPIYFNQEQTEINNIAAINADSSGNIWLFDQLSDHVVELVRACPEVITPVSQ